MVGTLGSTLERSAREQIYYDNGTNLRILPRGMSTKVDSEAISEIEAVNGVNSATMAFRQIARFGTTNQGPTFNVFGIDSESFGDIAWFDTKIAATNGKQMIV